MHFIFCLQVGGAENLVKEYALNLNEKKFNTEVLCLYHCSNNSYESILGNAGIKVTYISDMIKNTKYSLFDKFFKNIKKFYYVKKYISSVNPDIIHTHLTLNYYIRYAKPMKNTLIFHTIHSDINQYWMPQKKDNWKKRICKQLDYISVKWLIKNYKTRLIVLHEEMKENANEMFDINNTIVLNNGIDFESFNHPKSKLEIRKELGINMDSFVVGHIGRFVESKNHIFLLDIFEKIHSENDNAVLLLVGDGILRKEIQLKVEEKKLSQHVKILSNRVDIPNLLNSMDVFVFPSKHEGLGISLIEAQKIGLYCVVSEKIPKAAIISNLVKVVPLFEEDKWVNAICSEFKENIEYNDLESWDIKKITNKLEDIYSEVV
ncbi:MAG: glycosyltransferase [Bacilli bacterium]